MSDAPPDPAPGNHAPELPHFGKLFEYHGASGALMFRIDMQRPAAGDLVMLGGICEAGEERYPTGYVQDLRGERISVWVTESQYMRLTNRALD
ncbi:hypothetical protein [Sphingomonas sp. OTU376]|uniref:hypothetical protein n=1 Tax=Sphingomonas sp. OTU376 TaxID=3043863 RepID=UPI00313C7A97